MKHLLIILFLFLLFLESPGQTPVGTWSDHLVYNTANCVAAGTEEVFASNGSSLIVYNKEYAELKKVSRINGLTETGINTIGWSEENKTLVIGYTSSNIDILKNNIVYNIPDIYRKNLQGKKSINKIRVRNNYAYLACSFGIVVLDIIKKEIYDTWKPGSGSENTEVWDITFGEEKVFAATREGVFSADLSNPGLSYFGNWQLLNILPEPAGNYTSLVFSGDKLYANRSEPLSLGDWVYYYFGTTSTLFSYEPGMFNTSLDKSENGFTISSQGSARFFNNSGTLLNNINSYGWGAPNISQSVESDGDIWIADIYSGLIRGEKMTTFAALNLPGPASNEAINITSRNGKTLICGGAVDNSWNNLWRPFRLSGFENNNWFSTTSYTILDAMRAVVDPVASNHLYVSTWGGGLAEFENNILINQYTESNSPLQTIIPGQPYVRICGLAFDKNNSLWLTQSGVPGSIKVLKPDGNWIVNPVTIEAPTIGDIIITRQGVKWIILPRGHGIFVLDDNNTPDLFSDDRYKNVIPRDSENKSFSYIYSLAEDLDGNIWAGTDQGPLIYYNPEKIFDNEPAAFRIKIPRNDGSGFADYLLGTETITSIAVDGANRKWLGTSASGAYLLSPDGTTVVKNFNEQNSPLLSNSIVTLAVDNKTGDVWFGSSKGIQSVRGEAVEGNEVFSNVYTFPNPVREDFQGNVTITGLIRDSQIRITDISGNLVYSTVSDGGQATWDLKTYNGKKVTTGVYLVFCASNDGSRSYVTKMLVIK